MIITGHSFQVAESTRIVLAESSPDDRFAADTLEQELKLVTGRTVPVIHGRENPQRGSIVLTRMGNPATDALLRSHHLTSDVGSEGYVLDVQPGQVLLAGKDSSGLFYGVQTLRQLLVGGPRSSQIFGVRVRDWPAMAYRGTQVDLSRGPVPKLEYLKRIVRTIAEFKMNQLNLYMENALPLDGKPLVGALDDTLSIQDFRDLVSYAAHFHVDITPATEGCGHLHKVLRFEEYSDMAERPHGDLAADDESAARFLEESYGQLHLVFNSPFYNIGCDETHELGTGRSANLVQTEGYAKAYAMSVRRAYDIVHAYNKRVIIWGDLVMAHPEVLSVLPKDLIVATWEYFPQPSYDNWIKPFSDAGTKIIVCPWVGNTSLIVPNYEIAASNIANFMDAGKKAGAIGVNVTVWNDDGETLFAPNWWSIIYGAANAWEPSIVNVAEFDDKFDWVFYRNTDHRFTKALKTLSSVNALLHRQGINYVYSSEFGGANDRLFWRDLFSAEGHNDTAKILPVASELRRIAEENFTVFATSETRATRNRDTLKYFEFAALKLDALGFRYQALADISDRYDEILQREKTIAPAEVDNALFQIQGVNGTLFDLRDYTTRLRAIYQELWLQENLGSWLPNMTQLYDRNSAMWQDEIARFEAVKSDHREGKPLVPAESLGFLRRETRAAPENRN
jgi:hexosaminidase